MEKNTRLKSFLSVLFVLFVTISGQAQYLRTSYFLEGTHYRQQLNPALMPGRGYLNLPVIGTLNVTANSSSLGFQDIMDIVENSSDANYFTSDDFMKRLDAVNQLNVNLSSDVLSAGWYAGKNFWSFNIGLRNEVSASIQKAMFEFMRDMDGLNVSDLSILRNFNKEVGKQSIRVNSYAEVGLGFARHINDRLTVGGRLKVLLGVADMKLDINEIKVNSSITGWDGNSNWENFAPEDIAKMEGRASIKVDASLENSSKFLEMKQSEGSDYIDDIDLGSFGFSGYGAAVDLGASYKLTENLTLSASVLDLGVVKWSKDNTEVARAHGNVDYDLADPTQVQEFIDKVSSGEILNYELLQMEVDKAVEKDRSMSLASTLVVGAEYALLNRYLKVGALYTSYFTKPETLNELTFSVNVCPKNYFNLAVSYSVLQGKGKTFGAAVKLGPLFVGTDYMFLGKNTNNVNAYIGFSVPLNKRKEV